MARLGSEIGRNRTRYFIDMVRRLLALTVFSALLLPGGIVTAQPASPSGSKDGELIVGFEPTATPAERASIHASENAKLKKSFDAIGAELVTLPANRSVAAAQASYSSRRGVRFAEPNH